MTSILIVDDDPGILRLSTLVLSSAGLPARPVSDAREGLALLQDEEPDLILLDLNMPGMDGRTFYQQARATGYRGPVLIFSAYGAAQAQRELGAQGFIEKPFDPDSLLQAVTKTLSVVDDFGAGRNGGDAPPNAESQSA